MSAESLKNGIRIEWKDMGPCSRKAEFTVSKELLDAEFADALKEAAKHAQLPGFRKGKAPLNLIKNRFQSLIEDDLLKHIHSCALEKAGEDKNVDIVSIGGLDSEAKPKQGEDYRFALDFDVAPEIKLPDYKGLSIVLPKSEPSEERLKERVSHLKGLYADYMTLEEPAAAGDMLKVSYSSDFPLAEDASASLRRAVSSDENWIWLSDPEQMPGVNKALQGAVKGGEYSFTAEFPENWREPALSSKKVSYKVKVAEVQRRVPVDSDEKLAEKLKAPSVERMMEDLKKAVEAEDARKRKDMLRDRALESVMSAIPEFPIPKSIFNSTTEREFSRIAERVVRSENDVEKFKADKEKHLEDARKSAESYLKRFFVLRRIASLEGIKIDQGEIDRQIQGMSSYLGYKEKDVRKMMERNGGMGEMHADLLMGKVLDFIAEKAKVSEAS